MAVDSTRVCVGCGDAANPDNLERFVWEPRVGLLFDLRGKAPGRGAWVHPKPECLERAAKFGFRRSFRADVDAPEPTALVEEVRDAIRIRVDETARLAIRSGGASVGNNAVAQAMKEEGVDVVVLASDAGEATAKKFASNADRKNVTVVANFDGATLAGWSGRDFVAVLSIKGRLAERFVRDARTLEELGFFEG